MLIGFVVISLVQLVVSLAIITLIVWPQSLQLNETLLKFQEWNNVKDQAVESNVSQSTNQSKIVVRDVNIEIGYKSLICSRPFIPQGVAYESKLAGFSKNESIDDFAETQFLLTCISVHYNKSECACSGTFWLLGVVGLAGAAALYLAAQICAYCVLDDGRNHGKNKFCECCSFAFSALLAVLFFAAAVLFDCNVIKSWPYKFINASGNVELYFNVPLTWKIAALLCYAFMVLFIFQAAVYVCALARQVEPGRRADKSSPVIVILQSNIGSGRSSEKSHSSAKVGQNQDSIRPTGVRNAPRRSKSGTSGSEHWSSSSTQERDKQNNDSLESKSLSSSRFKVSLANPLFSGSMDVSGSVPQPSWLLPNLVGDGNAKKQASSVDKSTPIQKEPPQEKKTVIEKKIP